MLGWWRVCTANTGDKGCVGCVYFVSGLDAHASNSYVVYATLPAKVASVRGVGLLRDDGDWVAGTCTDCLRLVVKRLR